jgi:hypothetical protein
VLSLQGNTLVMDHDCPDVNWFQDSVVMIGPTDSVLVNPAPGCYYVWCYDCVTSYSNTVCVTAAGLEQIEAGDAGIELYPVPVRDRLRTSRMPATEADVSILDAAGRELYRSDARQLGTDAGLDVSFLSKGVYSLRIMEGGPPVVLRFVKL